MNNSEKVLFFSKIVFFFLQKCVLFVMFFFFKATGRPVVNQCAPNSYWIMQENGAEQPKVYRHTRTSLKIKSTPTDGEQKAQMREWMPETENMEFHTPAIPNGNRNLWLRILKNILHPVVSHCHYPH